MTNEVIYDSDNTVESDTRQNSVDEFEVII